MRRLFILILADGEEISETLSKEMKLFCDTIEVKYLYDFDPSDGQTGYVTLVILSSLVCQEINRIPQDIWKHLLIDSKNTLLLMYSRPEGEKAFRDLCSKLNIAETGLWKYNINRDQKQWYKAESQLKIMLSSLDHRTSSIVPQERYFTIKPNVINQDTTEAMVVLYEDHPNIRSMSAQIVNNTNNDTTTSKVKKLRNGVWILDTKDMKDGEYTIQINADNESLGEGTLNVQGDLEAITGSLGRLMQDNPRLLLSQLLDLQEDCFDEELADILQDSAPSMLGHLLHGLLKFNKHENTDSPDILHFLNEHGCIKTLQAMKTKRCWDDLGQYGNTGGATAPVVKQKYRHTCITPQKENDSKLCAADLLQTAVSSESDDEIIETTTSPLSSSSSQQNLSASGPPWRDSGLSTGSSTGSEGRTEPKPIPLTRRRLASEDDMSDDLAIAAHKIKTGETFPMKKSYSFNKPQREHPYEEIVPTNIVNRRPFPKPTEDPYDVPWEQNPLPQGEMPQKQTAGVIESTPL